MRAGTWRRVGQGAAALLATAAVTWCFRAAVSSANLTTVGFVYLLVVLGVASAFGLPEALLAVAAATLQYNFFFLPPVGAFTIQDPRNWVALVTFLITAAVASHLSTSARRRAAEAEQRRREITRLYALSRAGLLSDPEQIATQLERALVEIFALADARIELADQPASNGGMPQRWPLRVGQREFGALHLSGPLLSTESGEAVAGITAIALERARVLRESSHLQALRESEALKTALLDSVTHELRTPLTSIKAAVTALLGNESTPAAARRELLEVIDEESDGLNHVFQNLVDMARIEAGALGTSLRPQELQPIVEDALVRARVDPARVFTQAAPKLPLVLADARLLSQALAQLLSNAAAYAPPDSPIEIRLRSEGGEVVGEIADRGPGIAAASLPRLFEKFYRDPLARRMRPEGLGMGLAIARGILEAHHGRIRVTGAGPGACFEFALPATKGVAADADTGPHPDR